jgi:hypothetical protein
MVPDSSGFVDYSTNDDDDGNDSDDDRDYMEPVGIFNAHR